jgi:Holliday junction resolvase-like predicted endonuclease
LPKATFVWGGGYDGETLVFIEVRTRTARDDQAALPELSVTAEKQASGRSDRPAFF